MTCEAGISRVFRSECAVLGMGAFFQLEREGKGLGSFSPTSGYLRALG